MKEIEAAYTGLARVYDDFMGEVPYQEWARALTDVFRAAGNGSGLLLELGCGTGILTGLMDAAGYEMIGIDASAEMLSEALDKRCRSGADILYLQQDMRAFELYGTVSGVYCVCDSLNYLLEPEELVQVFSLINNYLDPGGLFALDFNTPAAYLLPERRIPIVETGDSGDTLIWLNQYDAETAIQEHQLTIFTACRDGRYERSDEMHRQRAYTLEEVLAAAGAAGLRPAGFWGGSTEEAPADESGRIRLLLREHGKEQP